MSRPCILTAFEQYEAELRGFLTRQSGDAALAEDVLQDVFVKALGEGAAFCSLENSRAWLFRVARNRLVDVWRRTRPTEALDEQLAAEAPEIPAVESLSECVPFALQDLRPEDREAIELCDLQGMAQADYAERLGISLSGAKSRVQRARKRLKDALHQRCAVRYDEQGQVCCYSQQSAEAGCSDC